MKFEVVRESNTGWGEPGPIDVAGFADGFAAIEFARLLTQADKVHGVAVRICPETTLEVADDGVIINEDE